MTNAKTNTILAVFITNLGKYNEGELVGMWLNLPATAAEIAEAKKSIGLNDRYEEYFITDYESEKGVEVGEYSNIEALNEQAEKMAELDGYQLEILTALLDNYDFDEAMEILESGDYCYYGGCDTMEDVARMEMEESGSIYSIPEHLREYFDYEAYGNNLDTSGEFYGTENGYVEVFQ